MYESPIELMMSNIQTQIIEQQGEAIYKAVFDMGVNVKKDELIRALAYDRQQYEIGYAEGKRDAIAEIVRCKDCRYFYRDDEFNRAWCGYDKCVANEVAVNGYCYRGERREEE